MNTNEKKKREEEKKMENEIKKRWDTFMEKCLKTILVEVDTNNNLIEEGEQFKNSFQEKSCDLLIDAWSFFSKRMPQLMKVLEEDCGTVKNKLYIIPCLEKGNAFDIGNVFVKTSPHPTRAFVAMGHLSNKIETVSGRKMPVNPIIVPCSGQIEYTFLEKLNWKDSHIKNPNTVNLKITNIKKCLHDGGMAYDRIVVTDLTTWEALQNMDDYYMELENKNAMDFLLHAKARFTLEKQFLPDHEIFRPLETDLYSFFNPSYYIIHYVYYADVSIVGNFYDPAVTFEKDSDNWKKSEYENAANYFRHTEKPIKGHFYDPTNPNSNTSYWVKAEYKNTPIAFSFIKFDGGRIHTTRKGRELRKAIKNWGYNTSKQEIWETKFLQHFMEDKEPILSFANLNDRSELNLIKKQEDEITKSEDKILKIEDTTPDNEHKISNLTTSRGHDIKTEKNTTSDKTKTDKKCSVCGMIR